MRSLALFALLALTGCPQGLLPCRALGDCAAPDVCVAGKCVASCDSTADCTAGQSCVDGLCKAGGGEGEGAAAEGEGVAGEGEGEGATVCGNGQLDQNEQCDDDNTASGDGCSASCQVESGFVCTPTAP